MRDIVFVTGGSGHIGIQVIVDALKAGYLVRAAVRNETKAKKILSAPSIKTLSPGDNLGFVIVPNIFADKAYDEAIKGAVYAIHIASPMPEVYRQGTSYLTTFIEPAVKGTLNILEAAKKARSIKRVVITSSIVGIIPWKDLISDTADKVYNEKSRTISVPGPYYSSFEAYSASKVAALNETEAWLEREKITISFDVVSIFPGFVLGRDELVTKASEVFHGTNKVILGPATGLGYFLELNSTPGSSVHLRDVSLAHIKCLNLNIPGNQGYLLTSGGLRGTSWEDSFNIIAKEFPNAVENGIFSNNMKITTLPVKYDESASEKALGFKFRCFEDQITDLVAYYLELLDAVSK